MMKPKFVEQFADRHGKLRCYYRGSRKARRIPLPHPSDPSFQEAYRLASQPRKPKHKLQRVGVIYVARFRDCVKIGFSASLKFRIAGLQTGLPEKLELLGTIPGKEADERRLHHRFKAYRLSGEWFRLEGDVKRWANALG